MNLTIRPRRSTFSLFQSHLDLARMYWSALIQVGDTVVDATCGNGHDTLTLCQLALSTDKGWVYALDLQVDAIESTRQRLAAHLPLHLSHRVHLYHRCHSQFPDCITTGSVKAIVYNLGYLPGGNKEATTRCQTTLESIQKAEKLLQPGGLISVTCYIGHPEGSRERDSILSHAATLPSEEWSCCHHVWHNRRQAPSLLLIQKCL